MDEARLQLETLFDKYSADVAANGRTLRSPRSIPPITDAL